MRKASNIKPDAIVRVKFYTPDEGGWKRPTPPEQEVLTCIVEIAGRHHDVFFLLSDKGPLSPGMTVEEIPITFLNREAALEGVKVGEKFRLWEMGFKGEGEILKIIPKVDEKNI